MPRTTPSGTAVVEAQRAVDSRQAQGSEMTPAAGLQNIDLCSFKDVQTCAIVCVESRHGSKIMNARD